MKKYILSFLTSVVLVAFAPTDFLKEQLKLPRVRQVNVEKEERLKP